MLNDICPPNASDDQNTAPVYCRRNGSAWFVEIESCGLAGRRHGDFAIAEAFATGSGPIAAARTPAPARIVGRPVTDGHPGGLADRHHLPHDIGLDGFPGIFGFGFGQSLGPAPERALEAGDFARGLTRHFTTLAGEIPA